MKENKIQLGLLSILFILISCEKEVHDPLAYDGKVFTNGQLLNELFLYPESITYNNKSYTLECDVYRNFSPIGVCGNGPLPDSIPRFLEVYLALANEDNYFINDSLVLTEIFVVHKTEIWQPGYYRDTTIIDNLFHISRGPQWDIEEVVSIMCEFVDHKNKYIKLKQEDLKIQRID